MNPRAIQHVILIAVKKGITDGREIYNRLITAKPELVEREILQAFKTLEEQGLVDLTESYGEKFPTRVDLTAAGEKKVETDT